MSRLVRGEILTYRCVALIALSSWSAIAEAAPPVMSNVALYRRDAERIRTLPRSTRVFGTSTAVTLEERSDKPTQATNTSVLPLFAPLPTLNATDNTTYSSSRFELSDPAKPRSAFEQRTFPTPSLQVELPVFFDRHDAPLNTTTTRRGPRLPTYWGANAEPLLDNPIVLWRNGSPTPNYAPFDQPATPVDNRSGWARWNSSLWGVTATIGGFMVTMVAGFTLLPRDVTGWNRPEYRGFRGNFSSGPRFDNDHFYFNYVAHPIDGSEFYLIARNRGHTWWQGLAYAAAVSAGFEFLIESAYERASWQDLWITPVSGAVIGELRWQVKKALENPSTGKPVGTVNKILYVVIDPFDAVFKL